MKLWVGWDGSWVVARTKLVAQWDGETKYLAPRRGQCLDLGYSGDMGMLFGRLRLKMYEVVRVDVTIRKAKR